MDKKKGKIRRVYMTNSFDDEKLANIHTEVRETIS